MDDGNSCWHMDVPVSYYIELAVFYERSAFVSSAMGFQGDSGVSVPLGRLHGCRS